MDCAVVTSLLGIVEQLLLLLLQKPPHNNNNNLCFILPDDTEIILSTLKDKLHFLQAYLDNPKPMITSDPDRDEAVKRVDEEIRDVAMKAEDEIESKVGEVYLAANQQVKAAACEDLHRSLQKVVKDFECVEVRIRDHLQQQQITLHITSSSSSSSSSSKYDLESLDDEEMIGLDYGVRQIKDMLLSQSSSSSTQQLQAVSICGMPGTGMTTLAQCVYHDESIVSLFDIRAWTVASKLYNRRKLLIGILGCIVSLTTEISNKDDDQLAEQLCKILTGQRYLIFIDNLLTTEAWDESKASFPPNSNGSRVLITTPDMKVAHSLSSGMCIYQTSLLDLNNSWELLRRTASIIGEVELIGRRIVIGCRGIPLAIVLIGRLLATLNNSPKQWEDVETQFNNPSFHDDNPFRLLWHTIEVCYNYLPTYLKPCFLYLGSFPEGSEIHVKKLIQLWIAEGFLKSEMNKSSEEIGEGYLCDLINRRLVQVHKCSLDGKIKSCILHDSNMSFASQKHLVMRRIL